MRYWAQRAACKPDTLLSFNAATSASAVTGLVTLPGWLSLVCAATGRTTQVSATAVVVGLGTNAARARNVGSGSAWGLSVESARTNIAPFSHTLGSWTAGGSASVSTNAATSPDGTANAEQVTHSGAGLSYIFRDFAFATTKYTCSMWAQYVSGAGTAFRYRIPLAVGSSNQSSPDQTISGTWTRPAWTSATLTVGGTTSCLLQNNAATQALVANYYGIQIEDALYPGSYIPTPSSSAVARAADVLSTTQMGLICPGGFFDLDFVVAPNYAQNETTNDHDLFYLASTDRLYFKQSDQKIYAHFGGAADIVSGALTFARESQLRIQVSYKPSGRRLIVTNVDTSTVLYDSTTQSAGSAISLPGTAYILGTTTGAQECADLRSFTAFRPR